MTAIESAGLRIEVLGYQFPENNICVWDGNWLEIVFRCEQPGRKAAFRDHCLRTDELERYAQQLREMANGSIDEASLDTMEPYLKWQIKRGPRLLSHVREAQVHSEPNEFTFELNERDLGPLISRIDAVLSKYPVRARQP